MWSDDLAIPWITDTAAELPPALELAATGKCYQTFSRRGFDLNMQKGKTEAIIAFRGYGAPALRRQFQLGAAPGMECSLSDQNSVWLNFVPAYKHLGIYLSSDGGMQVELKHRIGQATSAFSQLAKPVLCNRHIAVKTRLRLFHALIGTKLFFGLGSWPTPCQRHIEKLSAVLARFLRKILGLTHYKDSTHTTHAQVFAQAGCLDVRARLAQDRLLLAHKLFQHGPAFLHHLLHCEHSQAGQSDSWLHGVFEDLHWLHTLDPSAIPLGWTVALTDPIDYWQSGGFGWKSLLRRLGARHVLQESMMTDVHHWHRKIFQALEHAGLHFSPRLQDIGRERGSADFQCSCGRAFTTSVGLATHQRRQHGVQSLEHHLLSGATCPACMKHFWSTQRLQQHLAYVSRRTGRNDCYQILMRAGFQADYERIPMPSLLDGLNRANWVQAQGPPACYRDLRVASIAQCGEELDELLRQQRSIPAPPDAREIRLLFFEQLETVTHSWFQDFCDAGFVADDITNLTQRWIDAIAGALERLGERHQHQQFDQWLEGCFLEWGSSHLGELIADFQDGEAEHLADEAFADFAQEFQTTADQQRIAFLRQRVKHLMQKSPDHPHRLPKVSDNAPLRHRSRLVPIRFEEQVEWHLKIRTVQWDQCLPPRSIPRLLKGDIPHFVFVHLFSGRRREGDVHWWLIQWAQCRGVRITILSMDTAVSLTGGNLQADSEAWAKLVELYELGAISATLAGAPCETFSAARHLRPPEASDGDGHRWPRPLRSADRLFGLPGLTMKELKQCMQGTAFSLQTLFVAALHLIHGGLFVSEHPACPDDPDKASIWRSAVIELLLRDPECRLQTVGQWRWGSATPKPTGLFSIRLPYLLRSMHTCADSTLAYPATVAQGVDEQGRFKTAACKEYPPRFCQALSKAFTDQFDFSLRRGQIRDCTVECESLLDWLHATSTESAPIHAFTTYRPDFQNL